MTVDYRNYAKYMGMSYWDWISAGRPTRDAESTFSKMPTLKSAQVLSVMTQTKDRLLALQGKRSSILTGELAQMWPQTSSKAPEVI